ncbi:uncharacterized protein LOC133362743 [Lethenteron reissneri]|uniref:uncharacterized protein LOC133362743 n=1 Tax=Lethenteron reissneri TaxID=7753 RepID=UPI002AB73D4F|nr:uncharacterized protein LOC133362743 [Lethenteron reissneri]
MPKALCVSAPPERIRERLELSVAALRELRLLREQHEATCGVGKRCTVERPLSELHMHSSRDKSVLKPWGSRPPKAGPRRPQLSCEFFDPSDRRPLEVVSEVARDHLAATTTAQTTGAAPPRPRSASHLPSSRSADDLGGGSDARTSPVGLADPVTSAPGRDPDPHFHCDLRSRDSSEVYRYPSPLHAVAMQSSAFLHRRGAGDDRDAAASPDGKPPPMSDGARRHRRHDDAGADDEVTATVAAPLGADKATAYIALLQRRERKAEAARANLSVRYEPAVPVPAATAYGVGGGAGGAVGSAVGGGGGALPALVRPASIAHYDTSRRHHDDDDDDGHDGGDDAERRWRASGPHVHPGAGDRRGKSPNLQQQQQQSTNGEHEFRRRALTSVSTDLRPQRGAGRWSAAAEPTAGALGWRPGELGGPRYQQREARICKLGHGSWAGSLHKSADLRGGHGDDGDSASSDHRRHPRNAARSSSPKGHRLREGVELVRQRFRLPGRRRGAGGEGASSEPDVSGGGRQLTEREEVAGGSSVFDCRRRLVPHPSEIRGIGAGAAGTGADGYRRWWLVEVPVGSCW